MSEPASISSGIAARYASAIFDLAKDSNELPAIEGDLNAIEAALAESADLRALISSPVYSREEQGNAVSALAGKMGLTQTVTNSLRLLAAKRRLFVLPHLLVALRGLIAEEKGEVTADVVSAKPMTEKQRDALTASLSKGVGKDIKLNLSVDDSLIGGLIIKVGSKMIDTSIRSKLAALQNTMKEVG